MEKIICPNCNGSKKYEIKEGNLKGEMVSCWHCQGTGKINKIEILRGKMFEAMIQDSVNLRQKILWNNSYNELIAAGEEQISCFEGSIKDGLEEGFIIDEYKGHLENFREWFEIFKMDLLVVKERKDLTLSKLITPLTKGK